MDIIATYHRGVIELTLVWSIQHLIDYPLYQTCSYRVRYRSRWYNNTLDCSLQAHGQITLRFLIPTSRSFSDGDLFRFSLVDDHLRRSFPSLVACVQTPLSEKADFAVCAYMSDTNSDAELRSFVAYQKVQNASFVILYASCCMEKLTNLFSKSIQAGFVRLVDFSWPRINRQVPEIINNQHAQISSCYYRYRNEVKALLMCDVDEYLYSETASVKNVINEVGKSGIEVGYVRKGRKNEV